MNTVAAAIETTVDVAIVGAGISGLTAARRLTQAGVESVLVVEANDRIGGRTQDLQVGDGVITEGGGQWVGPGQDRILGLLEELGLSTFKTHVEGKHIYYRKGKRKTFRGNNPPLGILAIADYLQLRSRLERMAAAVPAAAPWTAKKALAWDAVTFGHWLDENSYNAQAKALLTMAFTTVNGEDPHCTSLLRVLHTIATCGGVEHMINVTGGSQELRIVGGSQGISRALAAQLGDKVILNSPVFEIAQDAEGVLLKSARADIRCKRLIVAMSPGDAERIRFSPPLPVRRAALQRRWHNGTESKLFAIYQKPFWRTDGFSGQALTDLQHVPYVVDNSPPDGRLGILLTFMGTTGRDTVLDDAETRRQAVLDDLVKLFGPKAAEPLQFLEKDWVREPWIQGCVSTRSPGLLTSYTDATSVPVGRIHWAGTEAATVAYDGYMDGAVRAAERVVDEVRSALRSEADGPAMAGVIQHQKPVTSQQDRRFEQA